MLETPRSEKLVCRDCARTHVAEVAPTPWPSDAMHDTEGFVVERIEMLFRGRCPECAAVRARKQQQAG
jgi:Fe2+ or Zn2+ uptake regulation protein